MQNRGWKDQALGCLAAVGVFMVVGVSGAQATTLSELREITPGSSVSLREDVTLTAGAVAIKGRTVRITGASLETGGGVTATGLTGVVSGSRLRLSGGRFTVPSTVSSRVHKVDPESPLVFAFANGEPSRALGRIVSTKVKAPRQRLTLRATTESAVASVLPPAPSGTSFRYSLTYALSSNSWRVDAYLRDSSGSEQKVITGRIYGSEGNRYEFAISYTFPFQGKPVTIAGEAKGADIFQPEKLAELGGSLTGSIEVAKGVNLRGASFLWDESGITLSAAGSVACKQGELDARVTGVIGDGKNWSLGVVAGTPAGCVVTRDLSVGSASVAGSLKSVDGAVSGSLDVGGQVDVKFLPAGVDSWQGKLKFVYDGSGAGSFVDFGATAGIGSVQGKISLDGTFALAGDFNVAFAGSKTAFVGKLTRSTPDGDVVYDVGAEVSVDLGKKGSLTGRLQLTNSSLVLAGDVSLACPVSGAVQGAVSATIPLAGGNDWSVKVAGSAPKGCGVTREVVLASGTELGATLKSVGGVVSFAADGRVNVATSLVPTKSVFSVGLAFVASKAEYKVSLDATTSGASFAGDVASDGTFALKFRLDDVAFAGSKFGFSGLVKRTTPDGDVVYDVGAAVSVSLGAKGSLSGRLQLTNSSLVLSGNVSLACPVSGAIDGAVSATIPVAKGNDWSVTVAGSAPKGCGVTREVVLASGTTLGATLKSVGGVVSFTADGRVNVATSLVPTKSVFSVGFAFVASKAQYKVSLDATTSGASFAGDVASDGTFALKFNLDDLALAGVKLGAKGEVKRTSPAGAVVYSLAAGFTGNIQLVDKLYLRGVSVGITSAGGLTLGGTVRQVCRGGFIDASASGALRDSRNWSLAVKAEAPAGCAVARDFVIGSAAVAGSLKSDDGAVTGGLDVDGQVTATFLPAGADAWKGKLKFVYSGSGAGSFVDFAATAGIGSVQGKVNFDGTFALSGNFKVAFAGSTTAFAGTLIRETPDASVVYDVKGSASVDFGKKGSLSGRLQLTNSSLVLSGNVSLACPVSGAVQGAVSATIPVAKGNDWSLKVAGSTPNGCGLTREVVLASGTTLGATLKSVGGVVSFAADGRADVATRLVPTKSVFSVGFAFVASQAEYKVSLEATTAGASFAGDVASDGTFALKFNLDDLALAGVKLGAKGEVKRTSPAGAVVYSLAAGFTGNIQLVDKLYLRGVSVGITSAGGLTFGGTVRQVCSNGFVDASGSGALRDSRNWSLAVKAGAPAGCVVTRDLVVGSASLAGSLKSVDGAVTGALEASGQVDAKFLPAGADAWKGKLKFVYSGSGAGSFVDFAATAGIGSVQGKVNFDGTFALSGNFKVAFAGSTTAFAGKLTRATPSGDVVYSLDAAVSVSLGAKGSLSGRLKLTNSSLVLAGNVSLACPVSGAVQGSVSATIPVAKGNDWSLNVAGSTPSGCGVTREFVLARGTNLGATLKSVGGVVSFTADARVNVATSLVPTKSTFSVGFSFFASRGAYKIAVDASTPGAGFSGNVASDGTFGLKFRLDDLELGRVNFGAKGEITRKVPGGALAYSIGGQISGNIKLADNFYLQSGSLGISSTGGLTFGGKLRHVCTTGYIDTTASGSIRDSRNWDFSFNGVASSCVIGRGARFDRSALSGKIYSTDAKVYFDAGIFSPRIDLYSSSFLIIGETSTWLTNVGARITNTCDRCLEAGVTRLTFGATGNATFRLLFFTHVVAARVEGAFDIRGSSVRRVSVGITGAEWSFLSWPVQVVLINCMDGHVTDAFTTA